MRSVDKASIDATEWIRAVRGTRRGDFTPVVDVDGWVEEAGDAGPVLETPVKSWSDGARYHCSFCLDRCVSQFHVAFNQALTRPFVVTCGRCASKMS
jgi:hypothetical protein